MPSARIDTVRRFFADLGRGDLDAAMDLIIEDGVIDRRLSKSPSRGVARGRDAMRRAYAELTEAIEGVSWELTAVRAVGTDMVAIGTRLTATGRSSGADVMARGGWLLTFDGEMIAAGVLHQGYDEALLAARRRRLADSRLYFVCDARPRGGDPAPLLDAALRGGVDLIQLRDKDAGDDRLLEAARSFREAADRHGALFFLNDRPDLVADAHADGVHVGQDDLPVARARELAGPAALVGLSTHSPAQFDVATATATEHRPDQVSAGPVWETPTKRGRPAAGLELIRHATARSTQLPWFAIGGIDASNLGRVTAAGATRIVVVRAIRDADDPLGAARELRTALGAALI